MYVIELQNSHHLIVTLKYLYIASYLLLITYNNSFAYEKLKSNVKNVLSQKSIVNTYVTGFMKTGLIVTFCILNLKYSRHCSSLMLDCSHA